MRFPRTTVLATLAGLTMAVATAQPGPGQGPGAGRWGSKYTPAWSMMTPQERDEHRARMHSMTSHEACQTYHEQHHAQMAARAKERGSPMPAQPRRDACAGLKK